MAANSLYISPTTGTTSYTFDDNSNLTQILPPGVSPGDVGEQMYSYDQRNLLTNNTIGAGSSAYNSAADYVYDGNGSRVQQVDHTGSQPITTTYTNDNLGLSQVLVANDGVTTTHNLFGLDLISQQTNEQTNHRFLLADGLGSARTEMVGSTIETVTTYEPYGSLLAQTGTSGTVYGFTGEQYDASTGLLYLRARYYNPAIQLFMTRDTWQGDMYRPMSYNPWLYVYANPTNLTDPSGHDAWWCQDQQCRDSYYGFNFDPRDLTIWLYREMNANVNDPVVQTLRAKNSMGKGGMALGAGVVIIGCATEGPSPFVKGAGGIVVIGSGIIYADALLQFRDQVKNGARWDFKDEIGLELGPGFTLCSSGSCDSEIEYSVPGNIFFGYIGRASGFTALELYAGAGWAEFSDPAHDPSSKEYSGPYKGDLRTFGDDPIDYKAVNLGVQLWDRFGATITLGQFKSTLSGYLSGLAHHAPRTKPVAENIALEWPYPVGFFNNRGRVFTP